MTNRTRPPYTMSTDLATAITSTKFSDYLASTPYCLAANLGSFLTEDLFYNTMFVGSPEGDSLATTISELHHPEQGERQTLFALTGDRGSGKTTLIHDALRRKQHSRSVSHTPWDRLANSYVIDFEENAVASQDDKGLAGVVRESNPQLAAEELRLFIANTLLTASPGSTYPIATLFKDFYPSTPRRLQYLRNMSSDLIDFFLRLTPYVGEQGLTPPREEPTIFEHILTGYEVHTLIYLCGLSIIATATTRATHDDIYVLFDNIDCIGAENLNETLFDEVRGFDENFSGFMLNYCADDQQQLMELLDLFGHIVIVVALRETTHSIIARKHRELDRLFNQPPTTTGVYHMDEVARRRLEVYMAARHLIPEPANAPSACAIEDLLTLLTQRVISTELPLLFNGNETVLAWVLSQAAFYDHNALHTAAQQVHKVRQNACADTNDERSTQKAALEARAKDAREILARGAIISSVIDRLTSADCLRLDHILLSTPRLVLQQPGANHGHTPLPSIATPLPILVLTYLHNIRDGFGDDLTSKRRGVRLDRLLEYFADFFPNKMNGLLALANVLWRMYWREDEENRLWARLIRIEGLAAHGHQELIQAVRRFPNTAQGHRGDRNPYVRISSAGAAFIEFIYGHYEFAASHYVDTRAISLVEQMASSNLSSIRKSVSSTIQAFVNLTSNLTETIDACIDGNTFDESGKPLPNALAFVIYTHRPNRDVWQYYAERTTFNYLRYIDSARFLLCLDSATDTERIPICKILGEVELELTDIFRNNGSQGIQIRPDMIRRLDGTRSRIQEIVKYPMKNWHLDPFDLGELP